MHLRSTLGIMYYLGQGVPQNTSQALRWLHKVQMQKNEEEAVEAAAKQLSQLIIQETRQSRASQKTNISSMSLCESPIPIGTCVELRGLKSKPELNGYRGVVVGYVASLIDALWYWVMLVARRR